MGIFGQVLQLISVRDRLIPARHHREQVQLAIQVPPGVIFNALENAFHRFHLTAAGGTRAVKGAGLDEALDGPPVQFVAVHPLAEVVETGKRFFFTFPDHIFDQVAAHVFDRIEPEANLAFAVGRKAAA